MDNDDEWQGDRTEEKVSLLKNNKSCSTDKLKEWGNFVNFFLLTLELVQFCSPVVVVSW